MGTLYLIYKLLKLILIISIFKYVKCTIMLLSLSGTIKGKRFTTMRKIICLMM